MPPCFFKTEPQNKSMLDGIEVSEAEIKNKALTHSIVIKCKNEM